MELKEVLKELTDAWGVSGYEEAAAEVAVRHMKPYCDEVAVDKMGNVIALKRGDQSGDERKKILLAAHLDQIGLMVTKIEDGGFLRFTRNGGIDVTTLPGQEVSVMGKEIIKGLVGSKPPHLQEPGESGKPVKLEDLYIDTGLNKEELGDKVEVGTLVKVEGEFTDLGNGSFAAQAMDDRSGVASLVETLRRLTLRKHEWDVYAVATTQEEVGVRGATTAAFHLEPDVGIAIDVTFGNGPGISERDSCPLDKGPAISSGPNFHPTITKKLIDLAGENEITHQVERSPGLPGTDARAIQISRAGIPVGLVSIPLRNMHSTVEVLRLKDVERLAELLCVFIARLDSKFQEDLKCF